MDLVLKTWNSLNINDGSPFRASFPLGSKTNLSANPVTVNRAGDFPALSTTVLGAATLVIDVRIAGGGDLDTSRELIKRYFDITDPQRHTLVAWDADGGNTPWYVTGFPIRIAPGDHNVSFVITLALEYPYWKLVTAGTDTWNITASAQTHALTNSGNIRVAPSFAITPTTAASSGLRYRRWISVYNNLDISYTDPVEITNGGLDTATLTTAKMQADGDDFRVWMDGVEVDRWLYNMDAAATKCWINMSFAPRKQATIAAQLGNTATTVTFARTKTNLLFLQSLKRVVNRVLLIGSEAVTFSAANIDTFNYQITSLTRGRKGTTAATHAAAATIRHIEHDLWILYGDSTLSAPDTDDTVKPIFDLSSTNSIRSYSTIFHDKDSERPGAWKPEVPATRSGLSNAYTGYHNSFINPTEYMGMALIGANDYRTQNEVGTVSWSFSHPAKISFVTFTAEKYSTTTNAGAWPVVAGLQYLQPDAAWITVENISVPSVATAWQPVSLTTGAIPTPYYSTVRFVLDGTLDSTTNARAMIEIATIPAVSLVSNRVPTVSMGAEQNCTFLDFVLDNDTRGESLRCAVPIGINETLTIDCENKTASISDGGRAVVELSTDRDRWLDLNAGSNTLQFTDAGINGITLVTTHRDRTL